MLDQGQLLLADLDRAWPQTERLLRNSGPVLDIPVSQAGELRDLARSARELTAFLRDYDPELRATLRRTPDQVKQLQSLVADVADVLPPFLAQALPLTDEFVVHDPHLRALLQSYAPGLGTFTDVIRDGELRLELIPDKDARCRYDIARRDPRDPDRRTLQDHGGAPRRSSSSSAAPRTRPDRSHCRGSEARSPRPVRLHPQGVERGGQHGVVADQHDQLDAARSSSSPRSSAHRASSRSWSAYSRSVARSSSRSRGSSPRRRVRRDPVDLRGGEARAAAQAAVLRQLVRRPGERGHPQDDQLGLAAGQPAAGHQGPGEEQPAPEQPPVSAQGEEHGRRLGAGGPAGQPGEALHQQAGVAGASGRDPGGHRVGSRPARRTSGRVRLAPTFRPRISST